MYYFQLKICHFLSLCYINIRLFLSLTFSCIVIDNSGFLVMHPHFIETKSLKGQVHIAYLVRTYTITIRQRGILPTYLSQYLKILYYPKRFQFQSMFKKKSFIQFEPCYREFSLIFLSTNIFLLSFLIS